MAMVCLNFLILKILHDMVPRLPCPCPPLHSIHPFGQVKSCPHVASVELCGSVSRGMMIVDQRVGTLQVSQVVKYRGGTIGTKTDFLKVFK